MVSKGNYGKLLAMPKFFKVSTGAQEVYWEVFFLVTNPRTIRIIGALATQPRRFGEICTLLSQEEKIAEKTVAALLQRLIKNGLISKRIFAEIPPRTQYHLTPLGRTLVPVLQPVWDWVEHHFVHAAGAQLEQTLRCSVK